MATNRSLAANLTLSLQPTSSNTASYNLQSSVSSIANYSSVRTLLTNYRSNVSLSITAGRIQVRNYTNTTRSAQVTITLGGTQVYNQSITVRNNDYTTYTLGTLSTVTNINDYGVRLNLSDSSLQWDDGYLSIYLTMTFPWPTKGDKIVSSAFTNLGVNVTKNNSPFLYWNDHYSWQSEIYYTSGSFDSQGVIICAIDNLNTKLRDKIKIT